MAACVVIGNTAKGRATSNKRVYRPGLHLDFAILCNFIH
jgi:hypothetical protein